MKEKIRRFLMYGGLEQQVYHKLKEQILNGNRQNLLAFSLICCLAMSVMTALSFVMASLTELRVAYFGCAVAMLAMALVAAGPCKKRENLVLPCVYLFVFGVLGFGIALGTFITPNQVSVSFIVMLFAAPLLYTDSPIRMALAVLIGVVAYCVCALRTQTHDIFVQNMVSVIPYGLFGLVVSSFMMCIKVQRYAFEQENRFLSESDQLTGLLNRRSYDQHIRKVDAGEGEWTMVCAFDVNGLKTVNDNLGHRAGDELIVGAADCIQAVFGHYGACYRVGGDEFMALLTGPCPTAEELSEKLAERTHCWHGQLVSGMSISMGAVSADEGIALAQALQQADQRMYAAKAEYYRQSGVDRRRAHS